MILQRATKVLRHLAENFDFRASWKHLTVPLPTKKMLISLFLRLHRPQRLHNIELGGRGIRELTLQANEIEQMLKYRKASFPKSVSTAFVAHCSSR